MAWWMSFVVGVLLCSALVDAHGYLSSPSPRGQFANPKKRVDEEMAPTPGNTPNAPEFVCRNDPEMPKANWVTLTAGQSQAITVDYGANHIGDCFVYLTYDGDKSISDMKWFKIWEMHECYNRTKFSVPIPSYLPSGSHVIFRWEWYALHQSPSVEFYAQCVDATVTGNPSGKLPQPQVTMPGHLPLPSSGEYWTPYAYPVPPMKFTGPKLATLDGVPATQAPTSSGTPSSTTQTPSTQAPATCTGGVGAIFCACTNGGACDPGLVCNGAKVCVADSSVKSSSSAVYASVLSFAPVFLLAAKFLWY